MVGEEYEKFPDMEKVIEVTETVDFPSIYKNTYGEQYTEEQFKEFRDAVKKHIMQNGGLYTSIVGTGLGNAYVRPDNNELWANHAVTIVGWDDNYSKENFSDNGYTPEHDGAYIALNIINISENTNVTELISSATSLKRDYLSIVVEGINYEQFAKLKTENPNVNFSNATITINTSNVQENEVDISQYKELRKMLRKYFANTSYRVTNGILMKNCNKIDVTSSSKEPIEIKFKENYGMELNNSTIKIIYNINEQNNDEPLTTPAPTNSIPENSTSTNVTTENSVVTNETTNQA